MKRVIKTLVVLCCIVLLAVGGVVSYVLFVLDPNQFKPQIEAVAAEQGYPLRITGNIEWQFFPVLGLNLAGINLSGGLLSAEQVSASLALKPLLQKRIEVQSVDLKGVSANLVKDVSGVGNWESLGKTASSTPQPKPSSEPTVSEGGETTSIELAVQHVKLSDVNLDYLDEQAGSRVQAKALNLAVSGFNLGGRPFQWQQEGQVDVDGLPTIELSSRGTITIASDFSKIDLAGVEVDARSDANSKASLVVDGFVELDPLTVEMNLVLAPLNGANWAKALHVELPEMSNPKALSRLGLTTSILVDSEQYRLQPLQLDLDDTAFSGHAVYRADGSFVVNLEGTSINLDDYLAPEAPESAPETAGETGNKSPTASTAAVAASDEPIDLTALKDINGSLSTSMEKVIVKGLTVTNPQIQMAAADGLIQIKKIIADMYDGHIDGNAQLDARQPQLKITSAGAIETLQLQPLLTDLADEKRLSGGFEGTWTFNAAGKSAAQLQAASVANLALQASSLSIAELDIERNACTLAALVNQETAPALTWKNRTDLQDVTVQLRLQGEEVQIQKMAAGVENLAVAAKGKLNYATGKFEVPVDVAFVGQADPEKDCQVRDRWRNQLLPLRCKGNLDAFSAQTCLPDRKRLDDLLRDELKDKAEDKLRDVLQDKLNFDESEDLDNLLKGLLRR